MEIRIMTGFGKLGFLAVALACGAGIATAHPIPDAEAMVQVSGGADYSISVRFDTAAFVMQATPGHLGKELADEIRGMNDDELSSRIADAEKSFQKQLAVEFDGDREEPAALEFPAAEKVRSGAREHGTARRFVRIRGKIPHRTQSMTIAFPADLGRVLLTFEQEDAEPVRHTLTAGEKSPQLTLPATDLHSSIEGSTSFKFGLFAVALVAFATFGWLKRKSP